MAAAWDLGGLDLLVNNASHLGPSPQPRLADYEPRDLATGVRRRRAGAARPAAGGAAAAAPVRRDRGERQLRRCCRGLRGLGRVRLGQGRARPAVGGARGRGARPARLRAGPGRHAHRHAPARPSRARTSPTGRSPARWRCPRCGRCSSAARRAAATAPPTCCCPRARPGDGGARRRPAAGPVGHRAAGGTRPGPGRGAAAGRPAPAGSSTPPSATWPASSSPATWSSSTPRARCPRRSTASGPGRTVTVHVSTGLDDGTWAVELRPGPRADGPVAGRPAGRGRRAGRGPAARRGAVAGPRRGLVPAVAGPGPSCPARCPAYLGRHGRPIAYSYVRGDWPLRDYQTVFAREPGSAEMPSAGRPFTDRLVTDLVTAGVAVAPVTLHTGVSSLEVGEPPLPEPFTVPAATARLVEHTRSARRPGGRGRYDGHPRPRDRGRSGRQRVSRWRLDRPRPRTGPAGPGGRPAW